MGKTAVIVGAGPAGLTAARELQERTGFHVIVLERSQSIGGISRTVNYKGNRMDIGGHRFFSKSKRVMDWWLKLMPIEHHPDPHLDRLALPSEGDPKRMLERQRLSRIYYLRKFFDYPVKLNINTVANLGPARIAKIAASYAKARLLPRQHERSLEDFLVNRFGRELYLTFFKDYTEKVWGVTCDMIRPEWGAQRIKGLSISATLKHAARAALGWKAKSLAQDEVETSLIDRFLYPKYGPGQLWEDVAGRVQAAGGELLLGQRVIGMRLREGRIDEVTSVDDVTGQRRTFPADLAFSTMPIVELVEGISPGVPDDVRMVARGLVYRDFITVGLLVPRLKIKNMTRIPTRNQLIPDNWIYIQEHTVHLGRLQLFQNWSPYMVQDPDKVWMGLEYFCNVDDSLWRMSDAEFLSFAADELARIGIIERCDVLDGTVVRVEKSYPAYFGSYDQLSVVRNFTDAIDNLFLIGRNGMHRYNNSDHSMLTAMTAVDNIVSGRRDKANIWDVNTERSYHEGSS
jgi:protoporphyrinogen oxidase